jgi:tRNA-binding EMAP/Myf-like protein
MISYDDYQKIDIRIGQVLSAEKVPETDKLVKLSVDFGEIETVTDETGATKSVSRPRQIISGIALHFPVVSDLIGKKYAFVANLEPRVIKGFESQGMILAASVKEGDSPAFSILEVSSDIPPGTKVS